jgi:hypothetical protein
MKERGDMIAHVGQRRREAMQDEERVRQRAHEIWEEAGRPDGQHEAHWEQAAREIEAEGDDPSAVDAPDNSSTKA